MNLPPEHGGPGSDPRTHKWWYGLVWALIRSISRLPFWIVYLLADALFLGIWGLRLYRWQVTTQNLRFAFPECSPTQLRSYRRRYYRNFCHLFAEILKAISLSDADIRARVHILTPELVAEMYRQPSGAILWLHHAANFEWLNLRLSLEIPPQARVAAAYAPPTSAFADWAVHQYRKRFGLILLRANKRPLAILRALKEGFIMGFLSDQRPKHQPAYYFAPFFGKPTAFSLTVAKLAMDLQIPIYFAHMRRSARGKYTLALQEVGWEQWPEQYKTPDQLTDWYASALEALIREDPPAWLWSHDRWKQKPGPNDQFSRNLQVHGFPPNNPNPIITA